MSQLTIDDLVLWSESEYGGILVDFNPASFQTVVYFLREFAVSTADPLEQIGAFHSGDYLVVGKRYFLNNVIKGFHLSGNRHGLDF